MGAEQRFDGSTNGEVVEAYIKTRGADVDAGREVMRRVLTRAGLPAEEFAAKPLKKDGQNLTDENEQAISVEDYLNRVAFKHPAAIRGVVAFAMADPDNPDFESQKQAIIATVKAYT